MDKENPASPKEVVVKNKLSDSFTLTWAPSTDDVGVLGYKVFMNEKEIGIAAKPMFSFGELVAEKTYSIKIIAFDSESKVSPPTTISVKTDKFSAVDNTGNLYAWDFTGLNGEGRMTAKAILPGMSASSPAGLVSIHLPLLPRVDFNNNALSARNSTATTLAQALAQEQYFSFTIAPLKGNAFSIKQIEMKFISEGPRNFTLMSKKKGFQVENAIGTYPDTPPVQSIAIAGHDKINSSTEFRIYVWGSDNQWTGFGLNGLAISGSVKSETLSPFQTSLSASNLSETGFVLSWKAVKNAKEYEVYIDAILLGKTASLNMPVRNLKIGSTYTMTVKAFDRVKDISEVSNPFSVVIPDLTKPSVPKNLTVSGLGTDSFILNWEAADDNVGVTWYEVSKNGLDGGTTAAVFMPEPYLSPNTSYDMKVRAKDAAGNFSEWSKPLKVKTLSAK